MNEFEKVKDKKSYIAILINSIGSAYVFGGIICPVVFVVELFKSGLTEDTWWALNTAPVLFIGGIIFIKCGQILDDRKVYKSWLKIFRKNDYIEKIKNDVDFAKTVYDNCPNKKCLKYVISLNSDVINM